MNICIITDNEFLYREVKKIVANYDKKFCFDFYFSQYNGKLNEKYENSKDYNPILLKNCDNNFWKNYELFISLHCKQIFPDELVENYRCINIHPGLNPYNRGWYPQAFSIVNKFPVGVTIHEMDTQLDHGPIIIQKSIPIYESDTSYDVYCRIQDLELNLLKKHLLQLVLGDYTIENMVNDGNINYKEDFENLCQINLDEKGTFGHFIDVLRATTFPPYKNAYFYDKNGKRIWVSINLEGEM